MQLIDEIEIAYFRSFYKFKLRHLKDLNVIFGKNDSGKSNVVRALNLFFWGQPDHPHAYDFVTDFCEKRLQESEQAEDIRKFLYVKITFNTPVNFHRSLGERFYVKRQWTVTRGTNYHEEVSSSIQQSQRHIVTRLLNKIRFINIPAIKDLTIFEMLLANIYETLANSEEFERVMDRFSGEVQNLTREMFSTLPPDVSQETKIGAPTQMSQLFQTLDFETIAAGSARTKSLTRQRGDGVKARHIPELLNYISEHDSFEFHIWGFEEPENSLDFVAAQSEAMRLLALATGKQAQVFMTTHSPSFYLLDHKGVERYYIYKDDGVSVPLQGRDLQKFDIESAIGEGFYLPAVADALRNISNIEARAKEAEANANQLKQELQEFVTPVVLTEGRTDAQILLMAWSKLKEGEPPFRVRSCETGIENPGSGNGGAQSLAICLKGIASDHPHTVIGIFDYDEAGIKEQKLSRNFVEKLIGGERVKRSIHGKAYAALLPTPDFRQDCKEHKNLPIEFLFPDVDINREVDGNRLELKRKSAFASVGGKTYKMELEDVTHLKDIDGGKTEFAENVVPTLPRQSFEAFGAVFDLIEAIIEYENNQG